MYPWSIFVDEQEFVPELMWPRSVQTYERMRADTQMAALYQATTLGVQRFKYSLDPNGADSDMVAKLSADYNLPIKGEKVNQRMRSKRRFSFKRHIRLALLAGAYGHYYFEQVGAIGDGVNGRQNDGLWHLQKLAERPPRTIQDFRVASDGGLVSIIQNVHNGSAQWAFLPEIPVDRLVGYVWEQEGANWAGRSWFRECYKNWLIKDRLMRIDAINHERAGGVPYIEAHPGATYSEIKELNDMARGFRVGDTSGGAVPAGAKLQIARGTNSSVVDSIRYHDEAMARKFMLMIMQLGQTKVGSRALSTSFLDFWSHGLASIADWFCDTFNEHVIEDDVDWNWGEDVERVPLLVYEYEPELVTTDLAMAVDSGVIIMDDELEDFVRKELGLTDRGTPRLNPSQQLAKDGLSADVQAKKDAATAAAADKSGGSADAPSGSSAKAAPGAVGAPSRPLASAQPASRRMNHER